MSAKSFEQSIQAILRSEWDPIGISDNPKAQDEYASYLPLIIELAHQNVAVAVMTEHLLKLAQKHMGLEGDPKRTAAAAKNILAAR